MDIKYIMKFLTLVAANNNRPWFQEHKSEYQTAKTEFENGVGELIKAISSFDSEIAHLTPKDCCYRFYRDIRFSPDKSPYKRHFGAYICAHGKKALRGGYYFHLHPEHCLISVGCYWLPTNILTSVRNEIMGNIDDWRKAVENKQFVNYFGQPNSSSWDGVYPSDPKGFGLSCLKKSPKDFPKDYEFMKYLKMKDYCAWHCLEDNFFLQNDWADKAAAICKVAKPMMDFTNSVIDDY